MLVLSRKAQETVVVGDTTRTDTVRVTVLEINGNRVKLGFESPSGVPIYREEILNPGETPEHIGQAVHRAAMRVLRRRERRHRL